MHKLAVMAAIFLLPLASAQVPYEEIGFEVVVDESATPDGAGFYDISSFAIGEPGDGTLVFRYTTGDNSVSDPLASVAVFFGSPGGARSMGYSSSFAPWANGNIDSNTPDSCEATSNTVVHCIVSYEKVGGHVGATLTNPYLLSYLGVAYDWAPAPGGYAVGTALSLASQTPAGAPISPFGTSYVLTGCTLIDESACPQEEVPVERVFFYSNETTEKFTKEQSFGAPFDGDYTYNFSVNKLPAFLNYSVELTEGTVTFTVTDEFDELAVVTVEAGFEDSISLDGFEGNWTLVTSYTGFVGNATFSIESPGEAEPEGDDSEAPPPEGSEVPDDGEEVPADDGSDPEANQDEAGDESESTPGLAVPVLGLVLVALARRR